MLDFTSKINVFIDAEWVDKKHIVSLQVLIQTPGLKDKKYIIFNRLHHALLLRRGYYDSYLKKHDCTILFDEFDDHTDHLTALIYKHLFQSNYQVENVKLRCNLFFFFSPKDIWAAVGWHNFRNFVISENGSSKGLIMQKRNLMGTFSLDYGNHFTVCYKLKDVSGWTNTSLETFANGLGIVTSTKKLVDNYKDRMDYALEHFTDDFIKYAINDVVLLRQIVTAKIELINWLTKDVLKIPLEFSRDTIPMTQGRLVSSIFEFYLSNLVNKKNLDLDISPEILLKAAYAKLGVLDPDSKNYSKFRDSHQELLKNTNLSYFLTSEGAENVGRLTQKFSNAYLHQAFSQAGIKYFLHFFGNNSGIFNSLVQGGRCISERYKEFRDDYCADIDLSSCYGTALRAFSYPIGLPLVYAKTSNEIGITLGDFLSKNKNKLVDNLYQIIVSGNLTFNQDLIFSKITTEKRVKKFLIADDRKFSNSHVDATHIDADFVLLRTQIQNGIITADVLEVLKAVCSSQEMGEILKLEVQTACFWDKNLECETIEEWVRHVIESDGNFYFDEETQSTVDTRTRHWYKLPLENFIGTLVNERKRIKGEAKNASTAQERDTLMAKQQILKLIINVFYGICTSPFFSTGNAVLANNITARACMECWKMSRALNLHCSISDGGLISLNAVNFISNPDRKPGLAVFSDLYALQAHRSIKSSSLGGINWKDIFSDPQLHHRFKELDDLAWKHLLDFWNCFGLTMKIGVEHKLENVSLKIAHWSKAHYLLYRFNSETKEWDDCLYVIRGASKKTNLRPHPCYKILEACAQNTDFSEVELVYEHFKILRIAEWITIQKSKNRDDVIKSVRPGETLIETRRYRLNNLDKPIPTAEVFKKRANRATRKEFSTLFERCFQLGIDATVEALCKDKIPKLKRISEVVEQEITYDEFEEISDPLTSLALLQ